MRAFFRYFATFLVGSLLSAGLITLLIFSNILNIEKLKYQLPYYPLVTRNSPIKRVSTIATNQLKFKSVSYSLPSMSAGFISGGGAILPLTSHEILILNKSGDLYRFSQTADGANIVKVDSAIKTNNDVYGDYARSQNYVVRPGKNIGFAGLGMRAIDLLYIKSSGLIAVSYTQWQEKQNCAVLKVSVHKVDEHLKFITGSLWREVFETRPCLGLAHRKKKPFAGHQSGGRMIEGANGNFLITVGDFKHDGWNRADISQDVDTDFGKIFEVNPSNSQRLVFSKGHRNPQGLMVVAGGSIWSTEHGPTGGDELNLIIKGADYGWPKVTLGVNCAGCKGLTNGRHEGYQAPIYAWTPAIGVSNLIQVKGIDDSWNGNFLVAALVGQSLHRLIMTNGHVQLDEEIPTGDRIRDLYQAANGDVVLWSDSGKLTFLSRSTSQSKVEKLISSLPPAAQKTIAGCDQCHVFEKDLVRVGAVNLWGVYGRAVADTDFPKYSEAFMAAGGSWSHNRLDEFLKNPQKTIANNAMADEGIADDNIRKLIIGFLRQLQ